MDSIKKKMQSLATETERAQVFASMPKHKYKYKAQIQIQIQILATEAERAQMFYVTMQVLF